MISVSSAFTNQLNSTTRQWALKVEIARDEINSPYINISDRITHSRITHDFDRRNSTVQLDLDNYDYTYTPYNRTSLINQNSGNAYDPLIDARHKIRISEGLFTSGGAYEYVVKFTGILGDEIDADSMPGVIQLTARDYSKYMQDCYIYQSKTYAPQVVENIIQDLINTFLPGMGFVVHVSTPTQFMIGRPDTPYTAKDINLWDACQQLADAASQELRFLEDGTLVLRKVVKDFSAVTPVVNLDESKLSRDRISMSDADIRNHMVLKIQGLNPIEMKDQNSINQYGDRYMEIQQSLANVIATQEQAVQLVTGMLQELSTVRPTDNIEMPLYPIIQVADIVSLSNSKTGTNPAYNKFKVIQTQDEFASDRKRTTITLQGQNNYSVPIAIIPNPPTNLSYQMITRTIQNYPNSGWSGNSKTISFPMLTWNPPTTDISGNALTYTFGAYSIYRSGGASFGWIPIASMRSYIDSLNLTVNYFYDYTALSGTSYTYKIKAVSQAGGVSSDSFQMVINVPSASYT